MPQLDIIIFYEQVFITSLFFFVLFIFVITILLPEYLAKTFLETRIIERFEAVDVLYKLNQLTHEKLCKFNSSINIKTFKI